MPNMPVMGILAAVYVVFVLALLLMPNERHKQAMALAGWTLVAIPALVAIGRALLA